MLVTAALLTASASRTRYDLTVARMVSGITTLLGCTHNPPLLGPHQQSPRVQHTVVVELSQQASLGHLALVV